MLTKSKTIFFISLFICSGKVNQTEWKINSRSFFKVIVGNIIKAAVNTKSDVLKDEKINIWNIARYKNIL